MRSGLVLYRLVFIKNAPVCAGAFFLREIEGVAISGVAARGRSGSAARAGNADIFVRNFYRPRKKGEWERRVFGGGYAGLLFKQSGKMRVGGGENPADGCMEIVD